MKEAQLWKRIRPRLHENGARAYRIEAVATPGFPDAVWCPSLHGPKFLELKVGTLRLRNSQMKFIRELNEIGLPVYVVWQQKPRDQILVFLGMDVIAWGNSGGIDFDEWVEQYHERS